MLTAGCYHSIAITTNGMLYVFGRNNHGQLATGDQEERHIPHPVDDFVGQRILSVAAGFYHTIVLTTAIPIKSSTTTTILSSVKSRLGVGVSDLIDSSTLSAAEIAEKLNPSSSSSSSLYSNSYHNLGENKSLSSQQSLSLSHLLKDVSFLTGIEVNSKGVFIPAQFNIDKRSKVQNRDLLLFLMNHVDHLVKSNLTATLYSDDYLNTKSCSNSSNNSGVTIGDEIYYPDDAITWIGTLLRSVVIMLEICSSIIADTSGEVKLTLSYDDALTFMLKMIRIIATFIEDHSNCLIFIIEKIKRMKISFQFIKIQELDFMIDLLEIKQIKIDMKVNNVTSLLKILSFETYKKQEQEQEQEDNSIKKDNSNVNLHDRNIINSFEGLMLFRNILFKIFFSNVRKELEKHIIYQEILNTIAICVAQSYELIFPNTLIVSDFFLIIKKYTIGMIHNNTIKDNTINSNVITSATTIINIQSSSNQVAQQSLCLRILTIICTNFCVFDEVIRLFQKSKLNALKIFHCIINMYGHFSMYNLSKRATTTTTYASSTTSNKNNHNHNNGINADIRRLLSVFEHCLSNFVKCAIPIIFVSTITSKKKNNNAITTTDTTDNKDDTDAEILELGIRIIKDVLMDAMGLVDYVLQQQQQQHNQSNVDDILGQLRYGTIMPSVLPSILIYGISFAKYGCLILDVIPDLRCLVNKLQLINKPSAAVGGSNSLTNAPAATINSKSIAIIGSSSGSGKISDKRPGVNNTGMSGSIADRSKHLLLSTENSSISSSSSSSIRYGINAVNGSSSSPSSISNTEDSSTFDFQQQLHHFSGADDVTTQSKQRDYQQMHASWWFRIVKLSTIYIAKMSSSLIYISSNNNSKKSLYSFESLTQNEI